MEKHPANEQSLSEGILTFLKKELYSPKIDVHQLAGDASSRRYYRIVVGGQSWVLMVWEPFNDTVDYPFLSVLNHFSKHNVHVPKVIAKSPGLGVVLLEDLGDLTLERKFWESQSPAHSLPFYKLAIDELIKIHYSTTLDSDRSCTAFKISFDTAKLLWEMNYGKEHLLEKFCKLQLSAVEQKSIEKVFTDICTTLDKEDKFICHRDYHSRNLMIKLGQMRVIDFQDARMGPIQYDLVSLLHDSYVQLDDVVREEILKYYLEYAKDVYKNIVNRDQFDEIFKLQLIQRCFKACGSFSSFYNLRQDVRYLKYLGPTIKKVGSHLEGLKQYNDFYKILNDNGLFEKDYINL